MNNLCSYFVKNTKDLIPQPRNIIRGSKYRFSILSPRLIRIEYNKNGVFEDRATSLVINRNLGNVSFTQNKDELSLKITTDYFTLIYLLEQPITNNNIKVTINGTDREWTPNSKEVRNVGGISYSLDDLNSNFKLDKGLYSLDGYAIIDDSKNFVIDNSNFVKREDTTDLYLFVYRKRGSFHKFFAFGYLYRN